MKVKELQVRPKSFVHQGQQVFQNIRLFVTASGNLLSAYGADGRKVELLGDDEIDDVVFYSTESATKEFNRFAI